MDHGKRVAYLMFKILEPQGRFDGKRLRDICLMAMLHDVGAYKTEEIDKMVVFETIDVWEHSIYGYLFLKYFSPLKDLADVVLFHHAECDELEQLSPDNRLLAQLVSLCDRADIFLLHSGNDEGFRRYIEKYRDKKYYSEVIDMFLASGINIDTVYDEINSDAVFNKVFRETPLTGDEVSGYIKMIVYSIDFRSGQTVVHTVASTCIAGMLAGMLGVDGKDIERIKTGAMLHDIGKVGIPNHILESPGRLNPAEMEIMRTHAELTEQILDGNVDEDIKRIAARHHEKLNGTGYPHRLGADEITLYERIVAVADIFSALCGTRNYKNAYPKEKIVVIMEDMAMQNLLDEGIVSLALGRFEEIAEEVNKVSEPVVQAYNDMNGEYQRIRAEIKNKFKTWRDR
jgi:putative nucleotidyltransferase with HDIG domain